MSFLKALLGRPDPHSVFRLGNTPDDFIAQVARRKYWREIDKEILKTIGRNAAGDMELLRSFVFVSETYRLVEKNFVPLARDHESFFGCPLSGFAQTLYWLGSNISKKCPSVHDTDSQELQASIVLAAMAFECAILCDPFLLSAYYGMVVLYGRIGLRERALEWCQKYKNAESRLRSIPDDQLTLFQQAQKRLLDPDEAKRCLDEMARCVPELFGREPDGDAEFVSMRELIEQLEQQLCTWPRAEQTKMQSTGSSMSAPEVSSDASTPIRLEVLAEAMRHYDEVEKQFKEYMAARNRKPS